MRWLQGTLATRFHRLRAERGHLFQGRYKSLVVDSDEGSKRKGFGGAATVLPGF